MSMIRIGSLGVILIYTMVGYNASICINDVLKRW